MNEQIKLIVDLISIDLENKSLNQRIDYINDLRLEVHKLSPFKNEPVDYVRWVYNENVVSNDYNPNKVAPPEMELLEVSIMNDGYTQPIVTWKNENNCEVVDGFHRSRVGKESKIIKNRVNGYLPVVNIRNEQSGKNDRIASTIRHNRARGKHQVNAMSEIVIELKNRNWTNSRISKQLGMDEEEVLRLCQISGIENIFSDQDFSRAWESSDVDERFDILSDMVSEEEMNLFKIPNENDSTRIFHTYDKWECFKHGFFANKAQNLTDEECENIYVNVLTNEDLFRVALEKVISEWKHSCEHNLTNRSMNRIAWLGQASVCISHGIPSRYSYSWEKLTEEQKEKANKIAYEYLEKWLRDNGLNEVDINEALIIDRQIELY